MNFFRNISFTKNEVKVIIFVITVLTAGFFIKYYKEVLKGSHSRYDYSESDNEFKRRSELAGKNNLSLFKADSSASEDELMKLLQASDDSLKTKAKISGNEELSHIPEKSININTASKDELIELPGIGDAIAERIIIYREGKKGFKRIEDLMKVKGIGIKKFEKIKKYIKVD